MIVRAVGRAGFRARFGAGRRALAGALASVVLGCVLAGCVATLPSDPEGTLDDVRGGVLRVGVSTAPLWTEPGPADDGGPAGLEPDLVRAFAQSLDAEVEWTRGGEEQLVDQLHRDELDLVVGGLTASSPWADTAALTYPYAHTVGPEGAPQAHVMAVRLGENAFMVELERFLLAQEVRP